MKKPENQILVIFGASGDLTWRKLLPAIYNLFKKDLLPQQFAILGVGRSAISDVDFRIKMSDGIKKFAKLENEDKLKLFLQSLYYISIDTKNVDDYKKLKIRLLDIDIEHNIGGNYVYYLATPPELYSVVPKNLKAHNLCSECDNDGWKRLIVEKPFGYDLDDAKRLNTSLLESFSENQIYRIDHYLGKETAQNILVTRFYNGFFEPLWNRNYVDHVEITSAESVGVEGRGGYYDNSGALRDMIQNHILQLVALTAMEPPTVFNADSIRNEVLKVFQALRPLSEDDIKNNVIRGQYTESDIKGKKAVSYIDEDGVSNDSRTETYVAMKFFIDNWRWGGVPFYIRSGKKLPTRVTEIVIHFKATPHPVFNKGMQDNEIGNELVIRIQPDEGLLMKFGMKTPGAGFNVQPANLNFRYADISQEELPEAYERLLHDCMIGDASLFTRGDGVLAAWEFINPILEAWKNNNDIKLYGYPAGTWGPSNVDDLFEGSHTWRYPCKNLVNDGVFCEL